MARGIPGAANQPSDKNEKIQVLNANPVPAEVDMSPAGGRLDPETGATADRVNDPGQAAPVVRSALDHVVAPRAMVAQGLAPVMTGVAPEEQPVIRRFRVEATKSILDLTSGARTTLREGKEITDQQYNIRHLQQQGVRLRDITGLDANETL